MVLHEKRSLSPSQKNERGQKKRKNHLCGLRLSTAEDKTEKTCYTNLHILLIFTCQSN